MPALIRIAIMLGSALIALFVMGQIDDKSTSQITGIVIVIVGLILSRVVYARMMKD